MAQNERKDDDLAERLALSTPPMMGNDSERSGGSVNVSLSQDAAAIDDEERNGAAAAEQHEFSQHTLSSIDDDDETNGDLLVGSSSPQAAAATKQNSTTAGAAPSPPRLGGSLLQAALSLATPMLQSNKFTPTPSKDEEDDLLLLHDDSDHAIEVESSPATSLRKKLMLQQHQHEDSDNEYFSSNSMPGSPLSHDNILMNDDDRSTSEHPEFSSVGGEDSQEFMSAEFVLRRQSGAVDSGDALLNGGSSSQQDEGVDPPAVSIVTPVVQRIVSATSPAVQSDDETTNWIPLDEAEADIQTTTSVQNDDDKTPVNSQPLESIAVETADALDEQALSKSQTPTDEESEPLLLLDKKDGGESSSPPIDVSVSDNPLATASSSETNHSSASASEPLNQTENAAPDETVGDDEVRNRSLTEEKLDAQSSALVDPQEEQTSAMDSAASEMMDRDSGETGLARENALSVVEEQEAGSARDDESTVGVSNTVSVGSLPEESNNGGQGSTPVERRGNMEIQNSSERSTGSYRLSPASAKGAERSVTFEGHDSATLVISSDVTPFLGDIEDLTPTSSFEEKHDGKHPKTESLDDGEVPQASASPERNDEEKLVELNQTMGSEEMLASRGDEAVEEAHNAVKDVEQSGDNDAPTDSPLETLPESSSVSEEARREDGQMSAPEVVSFQAENVVIVAEESMASPAISSDETVDAASKANEDGGSAKNVVSEEEECHDPKESEGKEDDVTKDASVFQGSEEGDQVGVLTANEDVHTESTSNDALINGSVVGESTSPVNSVEEDLIAVPNVGVAQTVTEVSLEAAAEKETAEANETTNDSKMDDVHGGVALDEEDTLSRFRKMVKMGMPEGAVRQKMAIEGVDESLADSLFATPEDSLANDIASGATTPALVSAASTTDSLTPEEEETVSRFRKMTKMGMPEGAVRQKMAIEGVDERIADAVFGHVEESSNDAGSERASSASMPSSSPVPSTTDSLTPEEKETVSRFRKMTKMGMPEGAVRQKMAIEGVDERITDAVLGHFEETETLNDSSKDCASKDGAASESIPNSGSVPSATNSLTAEEEEIVSRFRKMTRMGMPEGAVRQKLAMEGIDARIADIVFDSSAFTCLNEVSVESDPEEQQEPPPTELCQEDEDIVQRFRKMKKMGIREGGIRQKMAAEGVEERLVDLVFSRVKTIVQPALEASHGSASVDLEPRVEAGVVEPAATIESTPSPKTPVEQTALESSSPESVTKIEQTSSTEDNDAKSPAKQNEECSESDTRATVSSSSFATTAASSGHILKLVSSTEATAPTPDFHNKARQSVVHESVSTAPEIKQSGRAGLVVAQVSPVPETRIASSSATMDCSRVHGPSTPLDGLECPSCHQKRQLGQQLGEGLPQHSVTPIDKVDSECSSISSATQTTPFASPRFRSPLFRRQDSNPSEPKKMADLIRRDVWSQDPTVVESALLTLAERAADRSNLVTIARTGGLLAIVRAMENHEEVAAVQVAGCKCLEKLALDHENELAIGDVGGIEAILHAMMGHFDNTLVQEAAWAALWNLSCGNADTQMAVDMAGGIEVLVTCMLGHSKDASVQKNACATLANLCVEHEERMEALAKAGGFVAIATALQLHWNDPDVRNEASYAMTILLGPSAETYDVPH